MKKGSSSIDYLLLTRVKWLQTTASQQVQERKIRENVRGEKWDTTTYLIKFHSFTHTSHVPNKPCVKTKGKLTNL